MTDNTVISATNSADIAINDATALTSPNLSLFAKALPKQLEQFQSETMQASPAATTCFLPFQVHITSIFQQQHMNWGHPFSLNRQFLPPSGNFNPAAMGVLWFQSSLFCSLLTIQSRPTHRSTTDRKPLMQFQEWPPPFLDPVPNCCALLDGEPYRSLHSEPCTADASNASTIRVRDYVGWHLPCKNFLQYHVHL